MAATSETRFPAAGVDAVPPPAMAQRAAQVGQAKAELGAADLLALAGLAGAFIAMGAVFATAVTAGAGELPVTIGNVIGGTLPVGAVYWFVYLRPERAVSR